MPLVCRYKPNRSKPRLFGLKDLERIACAIFENGQGTPEEIRDACEKCLPEREEECQEEKSLIEQSYPLLLAGLATLTLAIPVFRALRAVRTAFFAVRDVLTTWLSRIPWIGRYFQSSNIGAAAAGASFETAAAGLTPEYIAAVAQSQSILARIQAAVKVEGVTAGLLFLAGLQASLFDILPGDENGEQTDDGA